ncbi:hypothetical protein [Rosenbergiella nectarea]|uniref:hypothetical protein n=1 Tax=Rosenbergiella nectarea TaxID=988801 RepID=UPI001BDA9A6A|nr:hypothetical protein [Rosenbergiella nectarea]MBT0729641.1 hypothetical protein [Rosenbergiella nectarea subsp. apis]
MGIKKTTLSQMTHSYIRADNSTVPSTIIKPALRVESSCSVILHNPQGLTALDTNARSVSDFDQIGTGAKFFTTCLHSDISKLRNQYRLDIVGESEKYTSRHGYSTHFTRYRLADHSAAERAINSLISGDHSV